MWDAGWNRRGCGRAEFKWKSGGDGDMDSGKEERVEGKNSAMGKMIEKGKR